MTSNYQLPYGKKDFILKNSGKFEERYRKIQELGYGGYAKVYRVQNKKTKAVYACKELAKSKINDLTKFKNEINIMSKCDHPNIIKLYEIFETPKSFYLIMEKCNGGNLSYKVEQRRITGELFDEKIVSQVIWQIAYAIQYCHDVVKIVHRDLKPENILMTDLTPEADIRLLDFGLSKIIGNEEKCTEPYGTLSFVAPEVLQGKPYDKSVDLWSIGIITFLLLCGYLPFDDKHSEREIARQTIQDPVPFENKIWNKYSPEARTFVEGLLQKKPEKRYSIKELLEHPWIKKMDKVPNKRRDSKNANKFGYYTSKND